MRFSSIGDIVLTSPVLRCLKQQTGASVHFLCKESFRSVVASNPHIDRVFTFQKKVSEVLPALLAEQYDVVIDLHRNFRSLQVKWRLGKKAYSFRKLNLEKWLLVNLRIHRLPDVHIVDRYMACVAALGVKYDGQGLDFFIPEGNDWRQRIPAEEIPAEPFIAFVVGATHATKRLPLEKMIDLCSRIDQPVVLVGGKQESELGKQVAAAAGAHVYNYCGRMSLYESASVVRDAEQVLTHDTGLMHIAAAFRKKIVSVWGNTVPEFGMYPFYPTGMDANTSFQVNGLSCRPCSKIGYSQCPQGHFECMNKIPTDTIAANLNHSNSPKK